MDYQYELNPDGINEIVSRDSRSFIALREIRWSPGRPYKLDLRRYFVKDGDVEIPGKGVPIEEPDALTECLVRSGFGAPKVIIEELLERDTLASGLGQYTSSMTDEEYKGFIDDVSAERSKAIIDRGMTPEEFMQIL